MTTPPVSPDALPPTSPKKKRRRWPWIVLAVLAVLALIGHFSGSDKQNDTKHNTTAAASPASSTTSAPATPTPSATPTSTPTPTPSATPTPTPTPTPSDSAAGTKLTCADGSITGVTVRRVGDDAQVTWTGRQPTASEDAGFFVTVSNGNDIVRQLGKKIYTNGEIDQFVFDMSSAQQTNLPHDGKGLTALSFPGAFTGITGAAKIDATVSVDGTDVEQCKA